jgi:hypothetical protein
VREARELLQLSLRERSPHRCDDRLQPGLAKREDVGVPLDHDRALLLRDRRARPVEPVEQVALAEELAFGRVDVLRAERVVLSQPTSLKAAHPPACIGERKEQPSGEVVVSAPVDEAGARELGRAEALITRLPRQRRAAGGEPKPVVAADLLPQPALTQVLACGLSRRGVPEVALVEARRLLEQRQEPLASAPRRVAFRRGLLVLERYAVPLGEPLDRLREVELLALADEADDVPAGAAAEAVVELVLRIHREAGRPLLVKGAEPGPAGPRPPQLRPARDDLDHVGRLDGRADGHVLDPRHYSSDSA